MALSEEEQRLLDQMEAALAQDDPRLAHTMRGTGGVVVDRRRAAVGAIGLVAGIGVLVLGMATTPVVSVLGFVIMLAAVVYGLRAWGRVEARDRRAGPGPKLVSHGSGSTFMDKMEEQWRRRMEDEGR